MKSALSISILIVFAYIQLFNGLVWMSYEINKSEIVQQFCENKDKPEMKCEGTCHMKKMMLTDDADEEGEPLMVLPEIELYLNDTGVEITNSNVATMKYKGYSNLYSFNFLNEREIPPKV